MKPPPLPCPFCGAAVSPYKGGQYCEQIERHYIKCYNKYCEINPGTAIPSGSEEEVIRRWNKRWVII